MQNNSDKNYKFVEFIKIRVSYEDYKNIYEPYFCTSDYDSKTKTVNLKVPIYKEKE